MDSIGEKIRVQRLIKNYSQEYMAFELDISQPAYSKIERGETRLSIDRVYEIAEILEIPASVLLPKSKYGLGLNAELLYGIWYKLKRLWHKRPPQTLDKARELNSAESDKSNIINE